MKKLSFIPLLITICFTATSQTDSAFNKKMDAFQLSVRAIDSARERQDMITAIEHFSVQFIDKNLSCKLVLDALVMALKIGKEYELSDQAIDLVLRLTVKDIEMMEESIRQAKKLLGRGSAKELIQKEEADTLPHVRSELRLPKADDLYVQWQSWSMSNIKERFQVLINGDTLTYDAVGTDDLESDMNYYTKDKWSYIGSSKVYFINGVRNESSELRHYFVRNQKMLRQ